ncbi:MAG TPA: PA14 domain-containing protein [Ktedonobacterales bacterium]
MTSPSSSSLRIYLGGSASDASAVQQFADALSQAGVGVSMSLSTEGGPAPTLPTNVDAYVILLSREGIASKWLLSAARDADMLCKKDSAHSLIPVFLESVPAAGAWSFLGQHTAVSGAFGAAGSIRMLVEQVLHRLDLSRQDTLVMPVADAPAGSAPSLPPDRRPTVRDLGASAMASGGLSGASQPDASESQAVAPSQPPPDQRPTMRDLSGPGAAGPVPEAPALSQAPRPSQPPLEWQETAVVPAPLMVAASMQRQREARQGATQGAGDEEKRRMPPLPILAGAGAVLLLLICGCIGIQLFMRGGSTDNAAHLTLTPTSDLGTATFDVTTATPPHAFITATVGKHPTATLTVTAAASMTATANNLTPTVPGASATPSATASATPIPSGTGLLGKYYNAPSEGNNMPAPAFPTSTPVLIRIDPQVDFTWGVVNGVEIVPDVHITGGYAISWSGSVLAPVTGQYTFVSYMSDDGTRIWINSQQLNLNPQNCSSPVQTNSWTTNYPYTYTSNVVTLQAGQRYPILAQYYENGEGGAQIHLDWITPGASTPVVIPQAVLYPN